MLSRGLQELVSGNEVARRTRPGELGRRTRSGLPDQLHHGAGACSIRRLARAVRLIDGVPSDCPIFALNLCTHQPEKHFVIGIGWDRLGCPVPPEGIDGQMARDCENPAGNVSRRGSNASSVPTDSAKASRACPPRDQH